MEDVKSGPPPYTAEAQNNSNGQQTNPHTHAGGYGYAPPQAGYTAYNYDQPNDAQLASQYSSPGLGNYGQQPGMSSQVSTNNTVVVTQPAPTTTIVVANAVNSYLGLAIFSCLCCFCPVGIFAIGLSCEVQSALEENDIDRARRLAMTSRTLSLISIAIGVIIGFVYFIVRMAV